MAIKRTITQACCGNNTATVQFYLSKSVTKDVLKVFEQENSKIPEGEEKWIIPNHYITSGILYLRRNGLVCSGSFGSTKLTIKCSAHNRDAKLDELEKLLESPIPE